MVYRYVPLIKAKAGEIAALDNLTAASSSRILPLIHVGENLTANFGKKLSAAWLGRPIAVDGAFNFNHKGSSTDLQLLITDLRVGGTPAIPSISPVDPPAHLAMVQSLKDANGILVKTGIATLASSYGWIAQNGWAAQETDLVIDLKHIGASDPQTFSGYVLSVLQQGAQALAQFRSVTLASASAPKDHGGLAYGPNRVPRTDWILWQSTYALSPVHLDYGDYCTGHPDLTEPPGAAMANATVSARYALDNEWLILKGRSTGGINGQPMAVQYASHAKAISADPGFGGSTFCWADGRISHVAGGGQGMGSRQKWAEIAANRHMSLVADRLP